MPFLAAIPIGAAVLGGSLAGAGIGAAGSIISSGQQAGAAKNAAQLQYLAQQQALDFQKQQWAQQQQNIAPWLQAGQGALGNLSWLMGVTPPGTQYSPNPTGGGYSAAPGMTTAPEFPQRTTPGTVYDAQGNPIRLRGGMQTPYGPGAPTGAGGVQNMMGLPAMTTVPTGGPTGQHIMGTPDALAVRAGAGGGVGTTRGGLPAGTRGPGGQPLAGGTPVTNPGNFGSLLQGWNQPFVPPTGATEQNDPGYQFRLQQGLGALQNSAAARGGLLSGNTLQGIENYAQDYASNEYQNVYNRSLGQYQQKYNIFQQNQANQFNRLAALSGIGQTAAGQLASAGQSAAGNVGNILLGSAGQIGSSLQNAGAARASGYAGLANAGIGATSNLAQLGGLLGGLYQNAPIDWSQISWG